MKIVGVFSKPDLRPSSHQLRIKYIDVAKSAFRSRHGFYEFLVMPISLTNEPTTFMDLINKVFHKYHDEFVIVSVNDILIYSNNEELYKKTPKNDIGCVVGKSALHQIY